ncbi:hypothetical protein [Mycolicibacterium grossiae]|uniref:PASTA domain-containing protein n=1 Tax=Mycolicibacterium grossiae TaxID=1552759 RepID=A0A1E8Q1M0_9MYCO|nr:hypothetical protein [Mycolicibacterium grossiae]OFJ51890.1 hypothetical protein BEL07_20360 [Mycolicibacterium grossiae]QEM44836.1 hypothetical protein FZ046_08585 [Mycolicibacterium grossiae]
MRCRATVLAGAAFAGLVLGTSSVAHASAPTVTGQKYSDAQSAISGAGMKAVVSTTVGDQKAWPDCLVSNQQVRQVAPPENSAGSTTNEVVVSLDCDADAASATKPGYSAASTEGRAIAAEAAKQKAQEKTKAATSG